MIDDVQFTETFIVTRFLALIHYIAGTYLYIMLITLIIIGLSLINWKLIKIVVNTVSGIIPGLKGKIHIE
jgi:hypothetical protein